MNKILFYTMGLYKGGSERVICNLANALINNYNITIVTNNKCESEYKLNDKIKHICIDDKKSTLLSKISKKRTNKLYKIIKDENPDIIIAFLPEPTIRILSLKKHFKNKKIIVSIRNNPKYEFPFVFKYIRNYYYRFSDYIVVQSDSYNSFLPDKLKKKCVTIPNYVKKDFYNISCNKKENIIVSVGRLEYQKNYKLLLKSFYKFNKKNPNYKLYIYGKGREKKKLQKFINNKKLNDKVILKGTKENINEEIINSKIFILTSKYEGMPNCLLEAMSLGLPVITTLSSPAIKDIIQNKVNGIIVKNNSNEIASNIETLIDNKDYLDKISSNSRKVIDLYNEENILEKWIKLIEK